MDKTKFAFTKVNYIICAVSVLVIIIGFCLMMGPGSTVEGGFEPDIFSTRRIVVAPVIVFLGFLAMIGGILYGGKKKEQTEDNQ